jgi:SAM-dependent methyltransferase
MSWFRKRRSPVTVVEAPRDRRSFFPFGRRYLADAPYLLPSDDQEINRLDFQHYMLRYALRGNYAAPIHQPGAILDVGTGTGRWALEMAILFPQANVVGMDLAAPPSEVLAYQGMEVRPKNYSFVQGDILQAFPFADASFDFVHQRLVFLAVPTARFQGVVNELVRVTRYGGWVELVEGGGLSQSSGDAVQTWLRWLGAASAQRGIDSRQGSQIAQFLTAAGLSSVRAHEYLLPAGKHGGRLGAMLASNFYAIIEAFRAPIVGAGIASLEEYNNIVSAVQADVGSGRCFWQVYLAYGQRQQ